MWPHVACAVKSAFDAFAYVLLALGIYGVLVLAVALIVIPLALQFDIKALSLAPDGEGLSYLALHAACRAFVARAFAWVHPYGANDALVAIESGTNSSYFSSVMSFLALTVASHLRVRR